MASLEIRQLDFSYFNNGFAVHNLALSVKSGEMVGLLGPNGSGKSTLIKLASGVLRPHRGEVKLDSLNLSRLGRKYIAQSVAVVPQQFHIPFAFTANEVVMLGRTPFLKVFTEGNKTDRKIVVDALESVGITRLGNRVFSELSGGEQQKVILAMALAQQPKLLLLDEPTSHLDIAHQIEILELVKSLNLERGLTIISAMHDLNLAALYFDRLILLKEGKILVDGTPTQVLTEARIREAFSASVRVEPHQVTGVPHIVVLPKKIMDKNQKGNY